ncbi:RNA-binding protein NOB1 [Erpetoichthys calabaricus]|uniref:RNA-binding protein NOB1 n=1 Tax=Erpetoichthys calabaricus TaxID=27687 RepID=A0A8C4T5I1_ERPCA|nr:RNA-binding protein NOB1 [Erpetoichthys calabaricus]
MSATMVEHVVADSGAFLKNAQLQEFGKKLYTLKEVVSEIRDKETKKRLAFLPYKLELKEPLPEYVKLVTEFSKKTGDYPSLSATDIKVLALTYQLEAEHVGVSHLKKEPEVKVLASSTHRHPETPFDIAGFHFPSKNTTEKPSNICSNLETPAPVDTEFNSFQFWRNPLPNIEAELLELLEFNESQKTKHNEDKYSGKDEGIDGEEDQGREDSGGNSDDDGGWITPSNIKQIQQEMGYSETPAQVTVGCLTTDFAMQNVLIHIGLNVLSINGMVIKQARNFVLRCHACFRTTSNMTKVFCPNCGNKTLKKVSVTIQEDGTFQMHFSRNPKVLNPRGLRHSLPKPQGGKHAHNPRLVEDQRFPQQRLSRKARKKTNALDPDYIAAVSPFCENDVYSRAANLNIRDEQSGAGRRRINPNMAGKKNMKRK